MPAMAAHSLGPSSFTSRPTRPTGKRFQLTPNARDMLAGSSRGNTTAGRPAPAPMRQNVSATTTEASSRNGATTKTRSTGRSASQTSDQINLLAAQAGLLSRSVAGKRSIDSVDGVSSATKTPVAVNADHCTMTTSAAQSALSPQSKRQKKGRNRAYALCKSETQIQRDHHIRNVTQSWNMPVDRWMELPHAPVEVGDRSMTPRARHPRDWATSFLAELDTLAKATRNALPVARLALNRVFNEQWAGLTGPQYLNSSMVACAIAICKAGQTDNTAVSARQNDTLTSERSPVELQGAGIETKQCSVQQARTPSAVRIPTLQPQQPQPRKELTLRVKTNAFASSQPDVFASANPQDMAFDFRIQKVKTARLEKETETAKLRLKEMTAFMAKRRAQARRQTRGNSVQNAVEVS